MKGSTYIIFALLLMTPALALQTDLLRTDPAPPIAGEYVDITLRITELSSQTNRQNVQVGILENRFIIPITAPRTYTSIRQGDQITATFRVFINEDTPEGELNLLTFTQEGTAQQITEHPLFVSGAQRQADLRVGRMSTIPQQLLPGTKRNELTLTLQNLGERSAELIMAELIVHDGLTESFAFSMQDSLASIPGGEQGQFIFTFDIDSEARGAIPAELNLEYRTRQEQGGAVRAQQLTLPVIIPLTNAPYLEIVDQQVRTQSTQGSSDNVLRITMRNTGEEEAVDVRVRLFPDVSFPFIFERTSQYVGAKIPPGQTASVDIRYEVTRSADVRDYEILVELESLVSTTRYTQTDTITIPVREGTGVPAQTIAGALIAGIVVLAIVIGVVRRKKKKK